MSAAAYFRKAVAALETVAESQAEPIARAAELMVDAVREGKSLYAFGASHSFILAEEMVYRTGGLMLVNPIYPHGMNLFVRPLPNTSRLERVPELGCELFNTVPARAGDVLIVASTSGRNPVPIDMALAAVDRGLHTIGITSLAYTEAVTSRHASGQKLKDICEVVIDNGAPHGDAAVEVSGFPQPVGPLSTVTGAAIVNAIVAQVVARLVELGEEPPVYMSANLDGGDAYNARLLAEHRDRIHYLD